MARYHPDEGCAGRDVDPEGDFECDRCDSNMIRFTGKRKYQANWRGKPKGVQLVNPIYYKDGTVETDLEENTLLKLPVLKRETGKIKIIWEGGKKCSYYSIDRINGVVERPKGPESPPVPYEKSQYEKERDGRVEKNNKHLAYLGLANGASGFVAARESKVLNSSWNLELENCCLISQHILILPKLSFYYTKTETEFQIRVRKFGIRVNRGR